MKKIVVVTMLVLALAFAVIGTASAENTKNYTAHLWEGPDNSGSQAVGQAVFRLSDDGNSVEYRLIVANIDNVTMSHIHLGPEGANGPVVVWLYPSAPPAMLIPGTTNGVLNTGTFTAADLKGPLAGQPLSALLEAMAAGNTYVNVHTTAFPPGEIRGQIK